LLKPSGVTAKYVPELICRLFVFDVFLQNCPRLIMAPSPFIDNVLFPEALQIISLKIT
jgi:hypothetical protein